MERVDLNLLVDSVGDVKVIRVKEERLVFQTLSAFTDNISRLIEEGSKNLVIDLSQVQYLDSASIGGLVDLYRQTSNPTNTHKINGLQQRLKTKNSLVGVHNLIDIYREEQTALDSFPATPVN